MEYEGRKIDCMLRDQSYRTAQWKKKQLDELELFCVEKRCLGDSKREIKKEKRLKKVSVLIQEHMIANEMSLSETSSVS